MNDVFQKVNELYGILTKKVEEYSVKENILAEKMKVVSEKEADYNSRIRSLVDREKAISIKESKIDIIAEAEKKKAEASKAEAVLNAKTDAFNKSSSERQAQLDKKEDDLDKMIKLYTEKDKRLEDAKRDFEEKKKSSLLKFVESELKK